MHTSKNDAEYYFGIGKDIVKEGIFERFPELIPAVGENYYRPDDTHKKLLIIGESNYFSKDLESESVFQDSEKWYKSQNVGLIPESMKTAVSNNTGYPPFLRVFKIVNEILIENDIEPQGSRLHETAFYNYFLRPALNPGNGLRKKIKPEKTDYEVAGIALKEIIKRLQPDLVIFISATAYNAFMKYLNNKEPETYSIYKVSHPSSIWWNRNSGIHGKEKFKKILRNHFIIRQQSK